jgi:hypothetical protein
MPHKRGHFLKSYPLLGGEEGMGLFVIFVNYLYKSWQKNKKSD